MCLCDSACVYNNNMWHLVMCGACVSPSPNVTLFLQLCKTSCRTGTDIPHMFFDFCDSVCSNYLHPLSCLSHTFHSSPPLAVYLPSIPSICVPLSDLADNLAMDDFTFQEQLLTPRLAPAGVGGVSSPAAPLWSSSLVPALPTMLALLLLCRHWPLHTPITSEERDKLFESSSSWCKVQQLIKWSMNRVKKKKKQIKNMPHFSLSVSARSCFVWFKTTGCSQETY